VGVHTYETGYLRNNGFNPDPIPKNVEEIWQHVV
jgi:hypothetical protein